MSTNAKIIEDTIKIHNNIATSVFSEIGIKEQGSQFSFKAEDGAVDLSAIVWGK
jgi:hypothetical protein